MGSSPLLCTASQPTLVVLDHQSLRPYWRPPLVTRAPTLRGLASCGGHLVLSLPRGFSQFYFGIKKNLFRQKPAVVVGSASARLCPASPTKSLYATAMHRTSRTCDLVSSVRLLLVWVRTRELHLACVGLLSLDSVESSISLKPVCGRSSTNARKKCSRFGTDFPIRY